MDIDKILTMPYSLLIKNLPDIVSSYSISTILSKGTWHRWNRMHNQRVIKNAIIPNEIEKCIIEKIRNLDEFSESKINIATLIISSWYISHSPFVAAIIELINEYLLISKDIINKNTVIIFDNLMRKKDRPFDTFYAGDLAWLLAIYFNTLIKDSKLVTYRNKNMESNFPQNQHFPFTNYSKQIFEIRDFDIYKDFDIFREIDEYTENDCILYITKSLGNYDRCGKLERIICKNHNAKQTIIVWELRPSERILSKEHKINFVKGFSEGNLNIIENIIRETNNV
jgi:hypothetical protein